MSVLEQPSKDRASAPPRPHAAKGVKIVGATAVAALALLALSVWGAVQLLR